MPSFWKATADALRPIFRPAGTLIEGVQPSSWASPQQPIRPTAQLATGVRQWDFTPGINLQFTPRSDTAVKFHNLWNVSNSFDLCRLFIETRKDQIVHREWVIRLKPKPGETKAQQTVRTGSDARIQKLTNLLNYPDGIHSFDLWIRMWLEQLLVFDAPCFYPVRNVFGDVIQMRLISGTTITPLLDQQGFRPLPPNPAYQQIILGIPTSNLTSSQSSQQKQTRDYTADELIYTPRNPRVDSRWGFPPVEQIITTLAIAANRQQFFKDYYTSGNVPEGLLPMPEAWTMQQIKDFQKWFDQMLAGNLAKKRRLIMIPESKQPAQFSKETVLTDQSDDYLTRVVAYAFSISPQNLVKQVNRGTAKESSDTAEIEGLEPYLSHIEDTLNLFIARCLGYDDVEFAYVDQREVDPLKQAQIDHIYIADGTYTRNEIRAARGDDPRPEPQADMLGIITPNGFVEIGQSAAPPDPEDDPNDKTPEPGEQKKKPTKALKSIVRIVGHDLTPKSEAERAKLTATLQRFLADQAKRIAAGGVEIVRSLRTRKMRKGDDPEQRKRHLAELVLLLNWRYPQLFSQAWPYLEEAAEDGANDAATQLATRGGGMDYLDDAKQAAANWAHNRAAEMVGLKVDQTGAVEADASAQQAISQTANEDVIELLWQALQEDWPDEQVIAMIEGLPSFSKERAGLIGEVETSRAHSVGQQIAWQKSKVVEKVMWVTDPASKCCDECASYEDLGPVEVGHRFAPGVYAPPDPHPFCKCALVVYKFAS